MKRRRRRISSKEATIFAVLILLAWRIVIWILLFFVAIKIIIAIIKYYQEKNKLKRTIHIQRIFLQARITIGLSKMRKKVNKKMEPQIHIVPKTI